MHTHTRAHTHESPHTKPLSHYTLHLLSITITSSSLPSPGSFLKRCCLKFRCMWSLSQINQNFLQSLVTHTHTHTHIYKPKIQTSPRAPFIHLCINMQSFTY